MTRTSDEIAAWFYYLEDQKSYSMGLESSEVIYCIFKVLHLFHTEKLIFPKLIFFGNIKKGIEIVDSRPEKVIIQILENLKLATPIHTIYIEGETQLLIDGKYRLEKRILDLTFEFGSVDFRFYINTYSDCWVPIDRDDKIQEELAIDASGRLENCLSGIEIEVSIKERSPGIYEENDGMYILPQKGNRVYTKSTLRNIITNDKSLKYFWDRRHTYPA